MLSQLQNTMNGTFVLSARFNGNIKKVIVDLVGERHLDPEAEAKIAMKRQ